MGRAMLRGMDRTLPAVEMTRNYSKPAAKPTDAHRITLRYDATRRADWRRPVKDERAAKRYRTPRKGWGLGCDWSTHTNWTDAPYPFES